MAYEIFPTSRFKKDYKLALKRGYNPDLLDEVVTTLSEGKQLAKNIAIMNFPESIQDAGNATLLQTGF